MNLSFLRDRAFMSEMRKLAIPVAIQQLITAGLNMIYVLMVGQLGESAIAALGLSNQLFFLLILFLFGTSSCMAVFTAQFWGKGEVEPIRKVLGMSLLVSSLSAGLFALVATLFPETFLRFYTKDTEVIALGASYLRIVGLSYVLVAISNSYIAVLRSTRRVQMTVIVTSIALFLKTGLGYALIFGLGGLPALGVRGAAIGTASGWTIELLLLLILVYALKTPLAASPLTFFRFDMSFFGRVLKTSMPAAANEVIWSVGMTVYAAVYAHIGTDAIAAINVNTTIEELGFVVFMGLGNACAVMVGNRIGAGQKQAAYETAWNTLILSLLAAILLGLIVIPLRGPIVGLYQLSLRGEANVRGLLLMMALTLWLRMHNFTLFIGALRAGGDTRFGLIMELLSVWLIGVPAALIGGFILRLPVYWVYLMVISEEAVKAIVIQWRFRSRKWIHDLVNISESP